MGLSRVHGPEGGAGAALGRENDLRSVPGKMIINLRFLYFGKTYKMKPDSPKFVGFVKDLRVEAI